MERSHDVVVIGGGPVGGNTARLIAQEGYNTLLVEEHKHIGIPPHCAGLITPRVFDMLDLPKQYIIQNIVYGANIHPPKGKTLIIEGNKKQACVIDRILFDKKIIESAKKHGTEILLDYRAINITQNKIILENKKNKEKKAISYKLLIGADGANSRIRKLCKLSNPAETLVGVGAEVYSVNLNPHFVEIFIGNHVAPGFFAWVIPIDYSGERARVGLCVSRQNSPRVRQYFEKFLGKLESLKIIKKEKKHTITGGFIPLGVMQKTYASHTMLVGDAAAQVKPTSGGGIYTGLKCSEHCAVTALKALTNNAFSEKSLSGYQSGWMKDIGKELKKGMEIRNLFVKFSDKDIDKIIMAINKPPILKLISKYGDIDYPSKLLPHLITKPRLLAELSPLLIKKIFQSSFSLPGAGGM